MYTYKKTISLIILLILSALSLSTQAKMVSISRPLKVTIDVRKVITGPYNVTFLSTVHNNRTDTAIAMTKSVYQPGENVNLEIMYENIPNPLFDELVDPENYYVFTFDDGTHSREDSFYKGIDKNVVKFNVCELSFDNDIWLISPGDSKSIVLTLKR